jgi:CIC family chloride channel protein
VYSARMSWIRWGRPLGYAVIVGICAGIAAVVFTLGLEGFQSLVLGNLMGYHSPHHPTTNPEAAFVLPQRGWLLVAIPALGGLLCGLIVNFFEPEAKGHGTDGMIKAFHRLAGRIPLRVPVVKAIASILVIGTGGSAGREGPMTQIGAGVGTAVAQFLNLADWDRRILMLAGAAGGLGAVFRAPLGGAMFAVEVLYSGTAIEFAALGPAFVASVVAYTVFVSFFGQSVMFALPRTPDPDNGSLPCAFHGAHELPFYILLALLCVGVAYVFSTAFYAVHDGFKRTAIPPWLRPALGGGAVGLIALLGHPHVMAGGYGWIQKVILASSDVTFQLAFTLVVLKIVATCLTVGSGGSGGLFAPALFVGAMTGAAFGWGCKFVFPLLTPPVPACVLVGMGGVLAATFKVPLAALIMVSELTGSHDLLVPMMLVGAVEMAVLPGRVSLCREQVPSFVDSPAHLGDFVIDVLKEMRVAEVCSLDKAPVVIPEHMPLPQILRIVAETPQSAFPVVDREERLVGVISLHDLRAVLVGDGAGDLVRAIDLAVPVRPAVPEDDLHTVLQILAESHLEELPIVASHDPGKVIGLIRREMILSAYDRRVSFLQSHAAAA